MRKLLSIFLFVIGCVGAQELWAQPGMDTLMKAPAINCDDVKYNASVLIPQFVREGELETAMEAHQFWTNNCAASEMSNLVGYMLNLLQDGKMDNVTDQELIVTLLNSELGLQEEHSGSYYFYNQTEGVVSVGAGYSFSLLGVQTARNGWSGLEFASGIPASVGGAVYMNAGANGRETCDALSEVSYVRLTGELVTFKRDQLEFGYRSSSFQKMKWLL